MNSIDIKRLLQNISKLNNDQYRIYKEKALFVNINFEKYCK